MEVDNNYLQAQDETQMESIHEQLLSHNIVETLHNLILRMSSQDLDSMDRAQLEERVAGSFLEHAEEILR